MENEEIVFGVQKGTFRGEGSSCSEASGDRTRIFEVELRTFKSETRNIEVEGGNAKKDI